MSYGRGGGYRDRDYRPFRPSRSPPVQEGKEYEVDITEMSRRGDAGVAKIENFIIFVTNAKPGDHVKIRITRVGNRYATADIVK